MIQAPDISSLYHSPKGVRLAMQNYANLLDELQVDYSTEFFQTPHGITHVLFAGPEDAPPVVLWHGMDASAPTWIAQINSLARQYRIIAPDIPGSMGKSCPDRFDRNSTAYGDWMAETLDACGIQSAHMAGISYGGWLILKLAEIHPEKIRSAILMSTAGFTRPAVKLIYRMLPFLLFGRFLSPEARVQRFIDVMGAPGIPPAKQDLDMFTVLLNHFKYEQAPGPLSDHVLRKLTAPTCILMGEHEAAFTPQKVIERAKAILPNLQHSEMLSGVGHGMISENPPLVNQRIMDFLETQTT